MIETARQISGSTTGVLLRYLRSLHGDEVVERVLAAAGDDRSAAEVEDINGWSSYLQAVALFASAAEVTGDSDVARRAGEEVLRQHAGTEVAALLRSLGSPGEVLRNVALTASKYSTVTVMEAEEVADTRAVVTARTAAPMIRHPHFCRFTEGVLSQAPALFGMDPAVVLEVECQTRGAVACRYVVAWEQEDATGRDPVRRAEFLEAQLAAMTERFEALQATASELASARDVDCTLDAITRRAGLAVRAPQFVLAVRVTDGEALRIHTVGVPVGADAEIAAEILADDPDDHGGSRLIVDVVAGGRRFGRLAAIFPDGAAFFAQERRLLESYAAHAAAALGTAAALDTARRRDRTARTLLGLAHSLADIGSREEVATRIAQAVLKIVDCDRAGVWLWDPDDQTISMGAVEGPAGPSDADLSGLRITPADTPVLAQLLARPRPTFVSVDSPEPFIRALLDATGLVLVAIVPMVSGGEFYGAVVAGVAEDPTRLDADDDVVERLTGVAGHGATALRNAALVEQIRHQALHDMLTGLPNQRLLEDRVVQALEHARRDDVRTGLLFLDLDGFKEVNDSLGHAAGDEVLRQVSRRLVDALRLSDTVARLGGDEFAVLLPRLNGPGCAAEVATKLGALLEEPFRVQGHDVRIGASIGAAVYPEHGVTFADLLRAADSAMYLDKRRRRALATP